MSTRKIISELPTHHIITIAGAGYRYGVPARDADAGWPLGVVRRPDGDLVVVDYQAHRLWRIDQAGILHPFAGDGVPGNRGDGGPALAARFYYPHDLTQDRAGNLYLSDLGNYTYRRIDYQTGIVTRVAGSGRKGRGGDGGLALDAEMDTTCGIAIDDVGNLYLSSEWGNNIRRVDATSGIITHYAGHEARHYPSERSNSRPFFGPGLTLGGYHGDGGPAAQAGFNNPEHLAFDSKGNLHVCDNANDRIRKIDRETGIVTTVFGDGQRSGQGDGGPATEASLLMPDAICFDIHDNLYVGEKYGFRIRKVEAETGIARTLVGNGVPGFGEEGLSGAQTHCNSVEAGIWADPDGTVIWGDCSGRLRQYDGQSGIVTTLLGGLTVHDGEVATNAFLCGPGGLAVDPAGHIYIADVWNQRIRRIDYHSDLIDTVAGNGARAYGGDGGPATSAYLGNPHDVAVDSYGRLLIADTRNGRLRRVDKDGIIQTIAGTTLPWDGGEGRWDKGDHGPANSASLVNLIAVTVGPNDDIYLGDSVGRIRRIDAATGIISTVAGTGKAGFSGDGGPATSGQIGSPAALCFAGGKLFFADSAYHVIRCISVDGTLKTVVGSGQYGCSPAGTPASAARLNRPRGVAIGTDGTLYFSDSGNNRVCYLARDGRIRVLAGDREGGDAGDGKNALAARLNEPHGLCLLSARTLLISDHFNNRLRAIRLPIRDQ